MKNYLLRIKKIKKQLAISRKERFAVAPSGTHHKVFLSSEYVIRFRDNNSELLLREANFLKKINHPLIPKIVWTGRIDKSTAMVENRLPGKTLDVLWRDLPEIDQTGIIKQIIQFLQYLKTQTKDHTYSVNTGKKYNNFLDYLSDDIELKISKIKKINHTNKILKDLLSVIEKPKIKDFFPAGGETALVHGDLINHNLLVDGGNLTGVIDWELALFGDPDHDLIRLFYYQECAKAYQEQGVDETFEADYMNKLIVAILKSNLIEDKKSFQSKYQFARAIFFLGALYWAVNSGDQEKNINELIVQWNKKNGVEYSRT